jgi:hypothetical protein
LVQEVPIGVNDIWLGEFVLNERDDMREVWLAGVLTVGDSSHGGGGKERMLRENDLYIRLGLRLWYDLVSNVRLAPTPEWS